MTVINSVVKNGKIELQTAVDWPEGTAVRIELVPISDSIRNCPDDSIDTPEMIARDLALMDRIEPMEITDEEQAEWETARQTQNDWEKARFIERSEALRKLWE